MRALVRDLRYAARSLAAQPGWTAAAVVCLAIGIGPNTAAFSVINGLLLRPLPYPDADRLVMVGLREPERLYTRPFSWTDYRELAPAVQPLAELAVRTFAPVALAVEGDSRMVQAELASANYFAVLRLRPAAGRFPTADGDRPGAPQEAVLGHALWQRRFNADPSIAGRVVRVNGREVTISGVAPVGFVGVTSIVAADLWLPATMAGTLTGVADDAAQFGTVGRLAPGASLDQLRARLDVALAARAIPGVRPSHSMVVRASGFGVPPAVRPTLIGATALLFGLIALVTGVAIANVASLTLARASDRRREIGVRVALGAGSTQIVRQMFAESLVLASAGGALGLVFAAWVMRALAALAPDAGQPEYIAFAIDVSPDWRVLLYAVAVGSIVAALFGLAPARHALRTDVVDALRGSAGAGRRPAAVRALMVIVVGQVAVSTTLLVGAGLLVRTYLNMLAIEPGIETRQLLTVSLDLDQVGIGAAEGRRVYEGILQRVSSLAPVDAAALTRDRPLRLSGRDIPVRSDAQPRGAQPHPAGAIAVTSAYFEMLGLRLVQGRWFTPADTGLPLVAVVNETMARRLWPDGLAIGRTFRAGRDGREPIQVIGIVRDVKYGSLTEGPRLVCYRPFAQDYAPQMSLLVRWRGGSAGTMQAIEDAIHAVNRDLAIVDARTLDEQVATAIAPRRQSAMFLLGVCGLGLLLSSVGLYGVIAYGVRRRARELGIRIALGATPRDVRRMVMAQGFRVTLVGLALGVAASLLLTRVLARFLYGVGRYDAATLAVACTVLAAVTLAAVYGPARWATRVDPIAALRED